MHLFSLLFCAGLKNVQLSLFELKKKEKEEKTRLSWLGKHTFKANEVETEAFETCAIFDSADTMFESPLKRSHFYILSILHYVQIPNLDGKQTVDIVTMNVNKQLTLIPLCQQTVDIGTINVNKQLTMVYSLNKQLKFQIPNLHDDGEQTVDIGTINVNKQLTLVPFKQTADNSTIM